MKDTKRVKDKSKVDEVYSSFLLLCIRHVFSVVFPEQWTSKNTDKGYLFFLLLCMMKA